MKYIGIDPGLEITGFGVIEYSKGEPQLLEYGVIRTLRMNTLPERLVLLHTDLAAILQRYPDVVCAGVEELFFAKNAKTAFMVGQARGVILFTLAQYGCTIQEVKPVQVKSAIVGSGRADKKDMQRTIQLLFRLSKPPTPDDAADAVAVALTAAAEYRREQLT